MSVCGWALTSFGAPCVAQRVCAMPSVAVGVVPRHVPFQGDDAALGLDDQSAARHGPAAGRCRPSRTRGTPGASGLPGGSGRPASSRCIRRCRTYASPRGADGYPPPPCTPTRVPPPVCPPVPGRRISLRWPVGRTFYRPAPGPPLSPTPRLLAIGATQKVTAPRPRRQEALPDGHRAGAVNRAATVRPALRESEGERCRGLWLGRSPAPHERKRRRSLMVAARIGLACGLCRAIASKLPGSGPSGGSRGPSRSRGVWF